VNTVPQVKLAVAPADGSMEFGNRDSPPWFPLWVITSGAREAHRTAIAEADLSGETDSEASVRDIESGWYGGIDSVRYQSWLLGAKPKRGGAGIALLRNK